jgi:hypothetical protein
MGQRRLKVGHGFIQGDGKIPECRPLLHDQSLDVSDAALGMGDGVAVPQGFSEEAGFIVALGRKSRTGRTGAHAAKSGVRAPPLEQFQNSTQAVRSKSQSDEGTVVAAQAFTTKDPVSHQVFLFAH